jgi:hypothetical protein
MISYLFLIGKAQKRRLTAAPQTQALNSVGIAAIVWNVEYVSALLRKHAAL